MEDSVTLYEELKKTQEEDIRQEVLDSDVSQSLATVVSRPPLTLLATLGKHYSCIKVQLHTRSKSVEWCDTGSSH